MDNYDRSWFWEIGILIFVTVAFVIMCNGCTVPVLPKTTTPEATQGDVTPTLTSLAEQVATLTNVISTQNSSTVNDLWPIAVMALIGVAGLVANKAITRGIVKQENRAQSANDTFDQRGWLGRLEERLTRKIKENGNGSNKEETT